MFLNISKTDQDCTKKNYVNKNITKIFFLNSLSPSFQTKKNNNIESANPKALVDNIKQEKPIKNVSRYCIKYFICNFKNLK